MTQLLRLLNDPDTGVRSTAAKATGLLGHAAVPPQALEKLIQLLDDPEADVRAAAADALGALSEKVTAVIVVSKLFELQNDTSTLVRQSARWALSRLARTRLRSEVFNLLWRHANSPDGQLRRRSVRLMRLIADKDSTIELQRRLLRLMRFWGESVCQVAAELLGDLHKTTPSIRLWRFLTPRQKLGYVVGGWIWDIWLRVTWK